MSSPAHVGSLVFQRAPPEYVNMSLEEELQQLKSRYSDELTKDEALNLAIEAAELHMKFLKLVQDKNEKVQLHERCNLFLNEAEKIKATDNWEPNGDLLLSFDAVSVAPPKLLPAPKNSRVLTTAEEIILLQGTKLHGCKFPPWQSPPNESEFQESPDTDNGLFLDDAEIRLSNDQNSILDDWKRPNDALPPPSWTAASISQFLPTMQATYKVDFVQDAATDCSVVASLAAATARAQLGHPRLLSSIFYPYDAKNHQPAMSPNGKYVVRLFFNGCARRVVVDDRLPVSKTKRVLYVVDRRNPGLLWPALLEKAYLKARGGYDFPGSNSGTDLWILTGWIPEQIFLRHEETDASILWPRIFKAFHAGDMIITLGTGQMTQNAERMSGLAGMHDYAVLNLIENERGRQLLVKNPWLQGTSWRDHRTVDLLSDDTKPYEDQAENNPHYRSDLADGSQGKGTFWMDLNDVMQYFDSIYLNWNPGLFRRRQDVHFKWDLSTGSDTGRSALGSFTNNPQFAVTCTHSGIMWLLLSRHITDKLNRDSLQNDDGFISLYAYVNNGTRVNLAKGFLLQGPYVDSPQTLLQLDAEAETSYTIVVCEEELSASLHTFTLSAFSNTAFKLDAAPARFKNKTITKSSWTQESAGGNADSETYAKNPQFSLTIPSRSSVSILLETLVSNVRVHCKVLHGYGERIYNVTTRDVIADSGNYSRGCAQAQVEELDPGPYTIICSTYETGQLGEFSLVAESMTNHHVAAIKREGAGKLRTKFADASFGNYIRVLAAPIQPLRLAKVTFQAKYIKPSASTFEQASLSSLDVHSPTRLTIESGRGPDRKILIASCGGAFSDSVGGFRTEELNINPGSPESKNMWIVLERLMGCEAVSRAEERIAVEMWADTIDCLHVGVWRETER